MIDRPSTVICEIYRVKDASRYTTDQVEQCDPFVKESDDFREAIVVFVDDDQRTDIGKYNDDAKHCEESA